MPSTTLAVLQGPGAGQFENRCGQGLVRIKINKTYHEMAEHYDTAVIPARVKHPR